MTKKYENNPLSHLDDAQLTKLLQDTGMPFDDIKQEKIIRNIKKKQRPTNKNKRYKKILMGIAAAAILIPTSAFAANKIWEVTTKKDGFLTTLFVQNEAEDTAYYRVDVTYVPKELTAIPQTQNMKYWRKETRDGGFSLALIKPEKNQKLTVPNAVDTVKSTSGQHDVYTVKRQGNGSSYDTVSYLMLPEENRILQIMFDHTVNKVQQEKIIAGLRLEKVTAQKATPVTPLNQNEGKAKENYTPLQENQKTIYHENEAFQASFGDKKDALKIQVKENASQKQLPDYAKRAYIGQVEEFAKAGLIDKTGNLDTYEGSSYQRGDGVKTIDQLLAKQKIQPQYREMTITITNQTTKKVKDLYFAPQLQLMNKVKAGYQFDEATYLQPFDHDGEPVFISEHGEGKSYYNIGNLAAHEMKKVTIGYIVINPAKKAEFLQFNLTGTGSMDLNNSAFTWVLLDE